MSLYLLTSWIWGSRGLCPLVRAWKLGGVVKVAKEAHVRIAG